MATEPSDDGQHLYAWPLGINLAILLILVGFSWPDVYGLGWLILLLTLPNGLLGFVFLLFERRRDTGYAGGFFLSFLLLLLIGFGMCSKEAKNHERREENAVPAPKS
ncbi:hypothetical protein [Hymenobacter negativus]|uniref:DUF805 domain-containing protein n=1 Tax=Hymenobacter negativus TaxID=2795026 RepID=A0ABS0Q596_9BACT|nr:hypothetical protein [Hymenobacter negativus]MBH8557833.1 hypothetical protein [Hymenobacter negativus]